MAEEVHSDAGGDPARIQQLARQIAASQAQTHRRRRVADLPARGAAWGLSTIPAIVLVVGAVVDPDYGSRLAAGLLTVPVVAAFLLTALGAVWLHHLARPPYSLRPSIWAAHATERAVSAQLENALRRAALFAAADVPLEDALAYAIGDDAHPAWYVSAWLADREAGVMTIHSATPVGRCTHALERQLSQGCAPDEALAATAETLQIKPAWAASPQVPRLLPAFLPPLVAGILPAALLLASV